MGSTSFQNALEVVLSSVKYNTLLSPVASSSFPHFPPIRVVANSNNVVKFITKF